MKTRVLLLLMLLNIICIYSQEKHFEVRPKGLDIGIYDPQKVDKRTLKVFYDKEADEEFEKVLQQDVKLREEFIQETIDNEGKIVFSREREIYEYYPDLGIVIEGGGHGYISAFDIKKMKKVCGNPITYAYSPSGKYRFSGLNIDGMYYYLDEKINEEYVCIGTIGNLREIVDGVYWADDETIYYLQEYKNDDGSKYKVSQSTKFYLVSEE